MANPWMKFYPRDWRGDQALRAVSIAARGLWMECLCIMHEARPYGHLVLNGEPVGDAALARMAGVSVDEVRSLLGELRQAGVLSVTRKGVIFSRRMTKDHARAQKGKAAVEKRWKAEERDAPQAPDAEEKSGAPTRPPNRPPTTQKPEARSQKVKREEADASSPKKRRGRRLPEDWSLPDEWRDWALSNGWPAPTVAEEAEKFRDYWIAQTGQRAVKLDWLATWRNWMRNASKLERIDGKRTGQSAGRSGPHGTLFAGFGAAACDDERGGAEPSAGLRDVTPAGEQEMADGPRRNASQPFLRLAHVGTRD